MIKSFCIVFGFATLLFSCTSPKETEQSTQGVNLSNLQISDNGRYFTTEDEEPFFWLGDTGWLIPSKLDREEVVRYFEDRSEKGFNVIQISVLHELAATNTYGDSALIGKNVSTPNITEGNSFGNADQYDYWDHVDYIVDKANEHDLYIAMVLVWGGNVRSGNVSREQALDYASFLAERYKDRPNMIWLNGGDTFGNDSTATWNIIGNTLNKKVPNHLITFHPRGRTQSSTWFHNEPWLDFNMFQSGHRRYDQDTAKAELRYGEDNWRYVEVDYSKTPIKPTLDGEPSYEGIPQGLHDATQPLWTDKAVRRYGYWSVFAGAAGYTYGHNAIMQMYKSTDDESAFGNTKVWTNALDDPGAQQMIYLKNLMLSQPYFTRVPDQSLIADQGERYDYQVATRGENYAFIYSYNGRNIKANMGRISGEEVKASWFSPRNGEVTELGSFSNEGVQTFDPPGEQEEGNDWVLVLETI
jgi:hypothetical protein